MVQHLAHREKVVALPGTYEGDPFVAGTSRGSTIRGSLTVFNVNRANANGLLKFKARTVP